MPLNIFSCFKPPATDGDTNTGTGTGPSNAEGSSTSTAGPSTSTAGPSTSTSTVGPSTALNLFSCFKPAANTNTGPSSSTAGPSTSGRAGRRRVESKFSLRYESLGESASGKDVYALDIKNSDLNLRYADEGSSSQSQITIDLPSFSLEELRRATNDFTECLGEGALGKVYKGHLDEEKQDVAIKWFNLQTRKQLGQFVLEVEVLRNVHHPNLLKLFGFCAEKEDRLVIYEYMALGSLDTNLFDLPPNRQPLDWKTRIKIAIDIASGLEYLHIQMKEYCILHGDLKSSNILLGEGYHAKLSDFGLATVAPKDDEIRVSTRNSGSMAYIASEFHTTSSLTRKTDIYSFGIVLLELITGKVAYDITRPVGQQKLNEWVCQYFLPVFKTKNKERYPEVADPLLAGQYSLVSLERALYIALWCVDVQISKMPNIEQVLKYLNKVIPPNDPSSSSNPASPRD